MKMLYLVVLVLVALFFYAKGELHYEKELEAKKEKEEEPNAESFMEKVYKNRFELINNVIPAEELKSGEEVWIIQKPEERWDYNFSYYSYSEMFWGTHFTLEEKEYGSTWLAFWDKPKHAGDWNAKLLTLADFKKHKDKPVWIIEMQPAAADKIEVEIVNEKPYKIKGEKIGSLYFRDYQKEWVAVKNEPELDYKTLQDYLPLNEEGNDINPKEYKKLFKHIGKKAIIEALYSLDKHRASAVYNRARKIQIKKIEEAENMLRDELITARDLEHLKIREYLFKLEERKKGLQEREQKL